jgi:hypothetical protein
MTLEDLESLPSGRNDSFSSSTESKPPNATKELSAGEWSTEPSRPLSEWAGKPETPPSLRLTPSFVTSSPDRSQLVNPGSAPESVSDTVYYWGPALTFFPDNRNVPYPKVVGSFLSNLRLSVNHQDHKEEPHPSAIRARAAYATRFDDLCTSLVNTINNNSSNEEDDEEEKMFSESIQSLGGEATIGGFGEKYNQFENRVNQQIRRIWSRNRATVMEPTGNWTSVNVDALFAEGDPSGYFENGGKRDVWSERNDVT